MNRRFRPKSVYCFLANFGVNFEIFLKCFWTGKLSNFPRFITALNIPLIDEINPQGYTSFWKWVIAQIIKKWPYAVFNFQLWLTEIQGIIVSGSITLMDKATAKSNGGIAFPGTWVIDQNEVCAWLLKLPINCPSELDISSKQCKTFIKS